MVSHRSLSDSKFPQVCRTLLSILTDLNTTVVSIVCPHLPISYSISFLSKRLGSFLATPIITIITTTLVLLSILLTPFRIFHISVNWWFLAGVWRTTSFLKSPGPFSVFWPISTMLLFGQSPLIPLFPSPRVLVPNLWWLYQEYQLQLV